MKGRERTNVNETDKGSRADKTRTGGNRRKGDSPAIECKGLGLLCY